MGPVNSAQDPLELPPQPQNTKKKKKNKRRKIKEGNTDANASGFISILTGTKGNIAKVNSRDTQLHT